MRKSMFELILFYLFGVCAGIIFVLVNNNGNGPQHDKIPPYQAFTLYFVLTFVAKNTCLNPFCHLFEQNMGNYSRLWMRHHGRMLGITFLWNRGAGGVKTPKHAKQHGKHGLNFSFSLSVFCDMQSCNGLNLKWVCLSKEGLKLKIGFDKYHETWALTCKTDQLETTCKSSSILSSFWKPSSSTSAGSASKGLQDPSRRKHKNPYASDSDIRRSLCTGEEV